jgi:hypothetical protein
MTTFGKWIIAAGAVGMLATVGLTLRARAEAPPPQEQPRLVAQPTVAPAPPQIEETFAKPPPPPPDEDEPQGS